MKTPIKILILADANAIHTQRWVRSLAEKDIRIRLFSLNKVEDSSRYDLPGVEVEQFGMHRKLITSGSKNFMKIGYLKAVLKIRKTISDFKPDIMHAHYASSYGLLGALSGFHPFIVSVWGSDVFDFPNQSSMHRLLLKFNLRKADRITSTSKAMAVETTKYTSKPATVIPFGIDTNIFKRQEIESFFMEDEIVIGTIKSLEPVYGIEYLVRAFEIIKKNHPELSIKLLIVGGGSLESKLKLHVKELGLTNSVVFTGHVKAEELQRFHNMIHIFVALSLQESFGVSILEASACSNPVVVSNAGGLPEIVKDRETGFVVPVKDEKAAAVAIEKLLMHPDFARQLGENGRKRVDKHYSWRKNVEEMIELYRKILEN